MLNIYLFIELLGGTDPSAAVERVRALSMTPCQVAHAVKLNDQKLVAQIDCPSTADADAVVLGRLMTVDGVVQTNVVAAVKPRR